MMLRTGVALAALLLGGCGLTDRASDGGKSGNNSLAAKRGERAEQACASEVTYDRLKELAFDEAARIRGDAAVALDRVAESAVVRMENPVVEERDEAMNVTICSGRFVLELPPGTENAFDGQRRLTADIQYAAQNAADGSGLVYQMEGAEPIIYRLATVGGLARAEAQPQSQPVRIPQASAPPGADRQVVAPPPAVPPAPREQPRPVRQAEAAPAPAPRVQPAPREAGAPGGARPSFNCRHARTRTERMVCANGGLAAQDRRMASAYYAELANADAQTRRRLRQTRDRFLARRERCGDAECVSAAYAEREREIREISGR